MLTAASPQALYFGPAGEPLFGWLHRPSGDDASDVGLVICNPFGFEEVCAHRSLKSLATATAAAGIPTLRFDYAGCGNSHGDDFQPQRLQAWVGSVHEAVAFMKRVSGLSRVCLLGLRLGAAIGALAAMERDDIDELIAVAPVVGGRAYLRELRALDAVKRQLRSSGESESEFLESAGYLMTRETGEAVGRLNLHLLPKAPTGRVLIVERDDLPGSDNWSETLERLGAAVTVVRWAGYVGMMDDPRRARVPEAIVRGVVDRIVQTKTARDGRVIPDGSLVAQSASFRVSTNAGDRTVRETVVQIDTGSSMLFGISSSELGARDPVERAGCSGVLMLNAGSVHHIGPDRMWVQLARAWAARGIVVLRLDISGIGDSPPRLGHADNDVYSSQAIHDVALALDYMRHQLRVERCHVLGLCSGAYLAFKAAVAGQAMESAVMINPLTFFWREGTVMDQELMEDEILQVASRYRRELFSRELWLKLLRRQLDLRVVIQVVVRRFTGVLSDKFRDLARLLGIRLEEDLAAKLLATVNLGTGLRFVFSATSPGYALLRRQGGRVVKRMCDSGELSIDLVPDADHTFTQLAARARLVSALERLMFSEERPRA